MCSCSYYNTIMSSVKNAPGGYGCVLRARIRRVFFYFPLVECAQQVAREDENVIECKKKKNAHCDRDVFPGVRLRFPPLLLRDRGRVIFPEGFYYCFDGVFTTCPVKSDLPTSRDDFIISYSHVLM